MHMIDSLKHLPRSTVADGALEDQFTDLAPPLSGRLAAIEAARCLYCYDAPCTRVCPTEIDVASFIRNIHDGNINGAAHGILKQNILGGSCARVCPTEILCEDACVRNHDEEGQPVKIGLLQRHALDHAHFEGHPFPRAPATGKTIAIVGAGPAGLNEYGIAKYKLTGDFAQREVDFLLSIGGIEVRHGRRLGADLTLQELHAQYDAVFLGLGLNACRELGLTGDDAPGLMAAVDYIAVLRQACDLAALPVPRRAIVIGAGNTAIDMAVQIKRLGAQDVTLVYRRGFESMSATHHELDIAKANYVRMRTWAAPLEVLLGDAGNVRGMRFEETRLDNDRLIGTGAFIEIAADAVFKAIGQSLDPAGLSDEMARQIERRGDRLHVDAQFRTALPGIYAGGDCIAPGQDLTVQAVQHGKLAAHAIHNDIQSKAGAAWPT
jgi:glutamate synthase (NADPH/NADH) small chain